MFIQLTRHQNISSKDSTSTPAIAMPNPAIIMPSPAPYYLDMCTTSLIIAYRSAATLCTSTPAPRLHTCIPCQQRHSVPPLCIHDTANCPTQLYAHIIPSYTYSSLPHFLIVCRRPCCSTCRERKVAELPMRQERTKAFSQIKYQKVGLLPCGQHAGSLVALHPRHVPRR